MESARNTLNAALADVSAREKAGRNAYKAAVAQLAEQIQARRDAAAAASAQLRLQKEQMRDQRLQALVSNIRESLGKDPTAEQVEKTAKRFSKLIGNYLGKNISQADAISWIAERGLYDPSSFTSSSKTKQPSTSTDFAFGNRTYVKDKNGNRIY